MNCTRHATSTSSDRVGLDHVGFIVDDLEEARALFAALGFTLTPRADHTRRNAAGEVIPAGSSQHSAMFDDGYIELMQITDPDAGHQLTPAMRERFGLHVVAFGTSDAPACHAARQQAGLSVGAVMDWSRPVKTAEREGMARFHYFDSPWTRGDPAYLCWVHHMTPDLIRSPSLLKHANGATALRGIRLSGPAPLITPWTGRLLQAGGLAHGPASIRFGNSVIEWATDPALEVMRPTMIMIGMTHPDILAERAQRLGLEVRAGTNGATEVDLNRVFGLQLRAERSGSGAAR